MKSAGCDEHGDDGAARFIFLSLIFLSVFLPLISCLCGEKTEDKKTQDRKMCGQSAVIEGSESEAVRSGHPFGVRQFIAALPCETRRLITDDDNSHRAANKELPISVEGKAAMNRRSPKGQTSYSAHTQTVRLCDYKASTQLGKVEKRSKRRVSSGSRVRTSSGSDLKRSAPA